MFDCFKLKQLQTRKKENWQNIKTTFIVTLSHQEKPSINWAFEREPFPKAFLPCFILLIVLTTNVWEGALPITFLFFVSGSVSSQLIPIRLLVVLISNGGRRCAFQTIGQSDHWRECWQFHEHFWQFPMLSWFPNNWPVWPLTRMSAHFADGRSLPPNSAPLTRALIKCPLTPPLLSELPPAGPKVKM